MHRAVHDMRPEEAQTFVSSANPVILEIGCNDGTDTNRFLETFPTAQIWCFEPDPRAIERFKETVHSDRVVLTEAALSDGDGSAVFNGSSGQPPKAQKQAGAEHYCFLNEWDLSGSLCPPTGHLQMSPWVTFPDDRRFEVKTLRLDTWMKGHPHIGCVDFIWADVQGAEGLLISGAENTLMRTEWFYTEYYDTPMYEGQPNLKAIREMLPQFDLYALYGQTNALFKATIA